MADDEAREEIQASHVGDGDPEESSTIVPGSSSGGEAGEAVPDSETTAPCGEEEAQPINTGDVAKSADAEGLEVTEGEADEKTDIDPAFFKSIMNCSF